MGGTTVSTGRAVMGSGAVGFLMFCVFLGMVTLALGAAACVVALICLLVF